MELHPIRRKSAGYHEKIITDQRIASATAIRHALEEGKRIAGLVPPQTEEDLSTCSLQTWESYWPYLRYRLLSSTLLELTDIYQMTEGIESRMKTAAATADSFEDFVSKVKTKRYT
ncbi:nucleotidyltransferase family protein, partial [Staphylococcus aureus]